MKRLRFLSGFGNGVATIPGGQVLSISMIPSVTAPAAGSYVKINESRPIFVPSGTNSLSIESQELGYVNDQIPISDMWPGETAITIEFGAAAPAEAGAPIGGAPQSWLVIYNGC